ncbi:hypothetical protein I4F81_004939 [Pyropia yezoensis]|uniref:Uncharacterized protein n=1 Tax=Pyropia yezoensis TaxID=2788 RepID=A0ACC3BWN7_PYRYE|nr:hypothetical protein I4F81_004939 [Neopyropia yezoensis]
MPPAGRRCPCTPVAAGGRPTPRRCRRCRSLVASSMLPLQPPALFGRGDAATAAWLPPPGPTDAAPAAAAATGWPPCLPPSPTGRARSRCHRPAADPPPLPAGGHACRHRLAAAVVATGCRLPTSRGHRRRLLAAPAAAAASPPLPPSAAVG